MRLDDRRVELSEIALQALGGLIILVTLLIILPWWVILLLIGAAMAGPGQDPRYKLEGIAAKENRNRAPDEERLGDAQRQTEPTANSTKWAAKKQRRWETRMAIRRLWAERFGTKGIIFYDDSYDD